MACNKSLQEPLPGFITDTQEKKKVKASLPGCRISPSGIEILNAILDRCERECRTPSNKDITYPTDLDFLYENIYSSTYGIYFHNLQYSTQMVTRCNTLGRVPNKFDIQNTFPKEKSLFSERLGRIAEISNISEINNPIEMGYRFWETWRMNGFDFTPPKHKNFNIPPYEIRNIWENENPGLNEIDINTFMKNFNTSRRELDPSQAVLLNEVFLLTNILFPDGNIQVPTYIDEIRIYNDFPKSKLEIVDYKTGDQFKEPREKEKVQIFLMMTACIKMLDLAHKVVWNNDWNSLPYINSKSKLISSIPFEILLSYSDIFKNQISFKYVNPVNQKEIYVTSKDIGIDTKDGILKMLTYIHKIGTFYKENRKILRYALDSKNAPFTLPIFPIEKDIMGNGYSRNVPTPLL